MRARPTCRIQRYHGKLGKLKCFLQSQIINLTFTQHCRSQNSGLQAVFMWLVLYFPTMFSDSAWLLLLSSCQTNLWHRAHWLNFAIPTIIIKENIWLLVENYVLFRQVSQLLATYQLTLQGASVVLPTREILIKV